MEYYYDKQLAKKYSIGIIGIIIILILLLINFKLFIIPGILFGIVAIWHSVGSFKMLIEIFTRRILVERRGIHLYKKETEEAFIPWDKIDDYSITETRCLLRVSGELYSINTQLHNFEKFEQTIIEQLNIPKEYRGKKLPKYNTLPSLGGKPDDTPDEETAAGNSNRLDYLKSEEEGTGFGPAAKIKERIQFTGESPEDRLKKLNLMEIIKDKYNPSYAGIHNENE